METKCSIRECPSLCSNLPNLSPPEKATQSRHILQPPDQLIASLLPKAILLLSADKAKPLPRRGYTWQANASLKLDQLPALIYSLPLYPVRWKIIRESKV